MKCGQNVISYVENKTVYFAETKFQTVLEINGYSKIYHVIENFDSR